MINGLEDLNEPEAEGTTELGNIRYKRLRPVRQLSYRVELKECGDMPFEVFLHIGPPAVCPPSEDPHTSIELETIGKFSQLFRFERIALSVVAIQGLGVVKQAMAETLAKQCLLTIELQESLEQVWFTLAPMNGSPTDPRLVGSMPAENEFFMKKERESK